MRRFSTSLISLLALTVVGNSAAGGGSAVVIGYGGKAGGPVGTVVTLHRAKPTHSGTTLPFTGFNLVWIAMIALLLLALGFALTRMGRKHEAS